MRYDLRPLAEQVMVITGASSGIGLVTARKAAAGGAKVVLVSRNEPALVAAVGQIEAAGGSATYAVADVGYAAEVDRAAALAVARFGRIDTWVNNAGVAIYAKLAETPLVEHERLFRTNYFGVVNGANAALPHLRATHGALITVASIVADIPSPLMGAYAASKHAVKGYIKSLRIELVADDVPVSVTLIKPAGIDTPIGQHAANHEGHEALIPPPVYDPELVADAILDAASHARRDLTVGGAGRFNVLFGTHFPNLLDRLAPMLIPALTNPKRPPSPDESLFSSAEAGRERSGVQPGRGFSLYTFSERHHLGAVAAGAATLGAALYAANRLRRRAGGAST